VTRGRAIALGGGVLVVVALVWAVVVLPGRYARVVPADAAPQPSTAPAAERKITATLYFISEDGLSLVGAKRDVPFGEPIAEQARHIVQTQLGAAPAPLAAAVPEGTTLRGLYLTERGDAFVDLSADVRAKHTGGALDELFTVYAIVNALTVNLPAITRVQILIEGKEVDTLAGHVDLRHPLQKNLKWTTP
jgi:spore germination protein GerM